MEWTMACRIELSLAVIPADQSPTDLKTYQYNYYTMLTVYNQLLAVHMS